MNFDIKWNKENYQKFLEYLDSLKDIEYKNFHAKLTKEDDLIGVKTPKLKSIAKDISKYNYQGFFKANTHKTYEERTIHGLVIGYLRNYDDTIFYLDRFFKYIDNWATCDLMCANLKIFKRNLDKGFIYINDLLSSNDGWKIRVALVLLNNYYVNDKYIDKLFDIADNVSCEQYYVKMSVAWLISTCYIKYQDKTYNYLLNNKLDDWIFNKTIQKIKESKRVGEKKKQELSLLKR